MRIALAVTAAVAAAVVAASFAGISKADTPTTVSIVSCVLQHGGKVTVAAGSTISFRFGWAARTLGLDQEFLNALDLNASIDGTAIADASSYWSAPAPAVINGNNVYLTNWLYPTGITLQSGDSVTLVWNGVLTRPITDGFTHGVFKGDVLGGNDTCTVTAS